MMICWWCIWLHEILDIFTCVNKTGWAGYGDDIFNAIIIKRKSLSLKPDMHLSHVFKTDTLDLLN